MIKGLAITPPVIGRVAIGKVVERNGRRLPEKDDEFTITSQVQGLEGWVPHPLDAVLREDGRSQGRSNRDKLRSIPVRLLFDDPELSLRVNYSLFDRASGRPQCVGNGETCRRVTQDGIETLDCPTPDACSFGEGNCKPYGRLHVRVGDDDELGSFVFRTTGFNSIRTLSARLRYFHAVSGGHLATMPLELRLRGKSTTMSYRVPIYYVDLTARAGKTLSQAIEDARQMAEALKASGFDQAALDEAAREGYAAGAFEESEEEGASVVEEFYPPADGEVPEPQVSKGTGGTGVWSGRRALKDALAERVAQRGPTGTTTGDAQMGGVGASGG